MPHLLARREESCRQGIRLDQRLDVHGPIHATVAAGGTPRAGLDTLKNRPEPRIIPSAAARIGPLIEVGRMAPDPDHRVDAAGAAEDLAARPVDDALAGSCLRGRAIRPIDIRAEGRWPKHGALQRRSTDIGITGLDQQDAARGVFGKARRDSAAGRTSADDDVIIGGENGAPAPALRDGCCCHLIHRSQGDCRRDAGGRGQSKESPSIDLTGSGARQQTGQEGTEGAFLHHAARWNTRLVTPSLTVRWVMVVCCASKRSARRLSVSTSALKR
jgi:hypothetical protein